jgi:glutamate---cysteine ligase / carboxylate-amine ligase
MQGGFEQDVAASKPIKAGGALASANNGKVGSRQRSLAPRARVAASWLAASFEDAFASAPALTVGLEEELILVDPDSLLPVDAIEHVLALVEGDDRFTAELRATQVELQTPICLTVADACRELAGARRHLAARLGDRLRLLAVGTHPVAAGASAVTARQRYQRIAGEWAWAVRRGQPSGLHVHVGLGDAGEALAVYNAARSYLPELAALAANSPFYDGVDSGLASARLKLTEDLPRSGIPPAFASWQELAEFSVWARTGDSPGDLSYLWWDLRPRPEYGTLEFRVADTQLTSADTGAIAAICRTLVAALAERRRAGGRLPIHECHRLNESRWRALRDGLDATLIDPDTGALGPARARISRLLLTLERHAESLGCTDELAHTWTLVEENGAIRQRRVASRQGIGGLLRWLADATASEMLERHSDPHAPSPAAVLRSATEYTDLTEALP